MFIIFSLESWFSILSRFARKKFDNLCALLSRGETHHVSIPTPNPSHSCCTIDSSIFSLVSEFSLTQTYFQLKKLLFCIFPFDIRDIAIKYGHKNSIFLLCATIRLKQCFTQDGNTRVNNTLYIIVIKHVILMRRKNSVNMWVAKYIYRTSVCIIP